jgi:uncharacterized protein (DUF488 family)
VADRKNRVPGLIDASDQRCPHTADWPRGAVFSLGHSTLPIQHFIALLETYGVKRVVDIRTVPGSRHNPQFGAAALARSLAASNLDYVHLKALGGLRRPREGLRNAAWRNTSFRGYADYMQTAAFQDALEILMQMGREKRISMMCAEAVPWRCHRSLVADALLVRGVPVIEILSPSNYRAHPLTPFAHVEGTQVTYPPAQASLL